MAEASAFFACSLNGVFFSSFAWFDVPILEQSWNISSFFQEQIKRRYINPLSRRRGGPALINRRVPSFTWVSGQGKKKNEEIQRKAREAAAAEEARKAEEERQRNLDQLSTKARGKKDAVFLHPKKNSRRNKKVTTLKRKNIYHFEGTMFSFVFLDVCFWCWGVLLVGRLGCISNWKYAGLHPPFCWIRIQFGKTRNLLGMVIPSQGWYKVWANRLTFSKLEKNMCWNGWSIYELLQDVDQQCMWSVLFGFFVGLAVCKWMDNLWSLPFIYPIVLYVWCLFVGGVFAFFLFLKVCPFSNFPKLSMWMCVW